MNCLAPCENQILRLRSPQESDLPQLLSIRNNLAVQYSLLAQPRPNTIDDVRNWLERRRAAADQVLYVIATTTADACCGFLQLVDLEPEKHSGWIGICISPDFHGQGLGRSAMELFHDKLAPALGLRVIDLDVATRNTRAIRLYLGLGYRPLSIKPAAYRCGDIVEDVMVMQKHLDEPS